MVETVNLPRFLSLTQDECDLLIENLVYAESNEDLYNLGLKIHEQVYNYLDELEADGQEFFWK